MRSYDPAQFLSKLSVDELPEPTELTIVGLAKSEGTSPSLLYFSLSPSCEKWITIPTEIVESIEHVKTITCRDHKHPVVRIRFKRVEEGQHDLAFFMNCRPSCRASFYALRVLAGRRQARPRHLPSHATSSIRRKAFKCVATKATNWSAPEWYSRCPVAEIRPVVEGSGE
jgi:hypothetical protein